MKINLVITVNRTDGPTVPTEEVGDALREALEGFVFEAGEDPSVFEIDSAQWGE